MSTKTLTAELFGRMVRNGAAELNRSRKEINDLNVFPIPDGDTGDNMYMTIAAGCQAAGSSTNLSEEAAAISRGMLFGARGNSGVILSRIFAGIAKSFDGQESSTVEGFISALQSGVKESYGAVSTAVEGTILTVFREGVEKVAAINPFTIDKCFEVMIPEMAASLKRTPDLLPVLKEAGVVDSGGAGILCIAQGMAAAVEGTILEEIEPRQSQAKATINLDAFGPDTELQFGYCTEFLLRLQNSKVDVENFDESVIIDYLNSVGESVVAFKDGSIVKVHVHTKTPGDILNHCQQYGEYLTVKVENMTLQHHETETKNNFHVAKKAFGAVTVASGAGLVSAIREAGADYVIEGGQTMNPSSEDFIKAFDAVNAETIFVFPNNSNIILAANQAAELYKESQIVVIPTKTIGEGYVAIASLDYSSKDADAIRENLLETISGVDTILVSKAIRDSEMDGVKVREGEFVGIGKGKIYACSESEKEAALESCRRVDAGSHDVALVFSGKDAEDPEEMAAALQAQWPMTEFIINAGDQPVYEYIIVLC